METQSKNYDRSCEQHKCGRETCGILEEAATQGDGWLQGHPVENGAKTHEPAHGDASSNRASSQVGHRFSLNKAEKSLLGPQMHISLPA